MGSSGRLRLEKVDNKIWPTAAIYKAVKQPYSLRHSTEAGAVFKSFLSRGVSAEADFQDVQSAVVAQRGPGKRPDLPLHTYIHYTHGGDTVSTVRLRRIPFHLVPQARFTNFTPRFGQLKPTHQLVPPTQPRYTPCSASAWRALPRPQTCQPRGCLTRRALQLARADGDI